MLSSLLQNFNKIWLSIVALNLILLVLLPDWFSKESIVSLLDGLGAFALVTYIVVSLARALLLLPITPFIIAGAISFPGMPGIIWIISTKSVVVGAGVVYSFPSFGGYDKYLEKKDLIKIGLSYSKQIVKTIPISDGDVKMDWIITEKDVIKTS